MQNVTSERKQEGGAVVEVESGSVITVVQEIWSSMLGLTAISAEHRKYPRQPQLALLGFVHFDGAWQGAVFLHCSSELARMVAAGMFGAEPDSLPIEEVHDAVGELVNIIGGNLKHLFPAPCHLSLPCVLKDKYREQTAVLGRLITDAAFVHENETFWVEVVEGQPSEIFTNNG